MSHLPKNTHSCNAPEIAHLQALVYIIFWDFKKWDFFVYIYRQWDSLVTRVSHFGEKNVGE